MSMNLPVRGTAMRVLVALLAVAGGVLLRLALLDFIGPRTPFMTFYPAMMVAALCGGLVSGLIATALMGLAAYFWALPQVQPFILGSASWMALGMFVFTGVLAAALAEALQRARTRATEAEVKAAVAEERCRVDPDLLRLAAIVESSDDAILSTTMDGFISSWNHGAERIYGYAAQEALGQPASMLCPPERSGEIPELLARIAAGENVRNLETVRLRKDGTRIHVSVTLSPIRSRDCSLAGISAIVRDISERKLTETALRESRQRLLFSQEIAMLGEWELNLTTNTLYWGPGVFRIFEIDPDTLSPSYEAFLALVHPEDRGLVDKAYTESLAAQRPYAIVHRLRLPGGRVKWVKESCRHEFDENGSPLRSLGIVQDITELKQAEAALRENEAFARTIIDNSPDCIKLLNASGELTYMSPSGPRLLELDSVEPLLGKPYLAFWKGSDHERAAQAFHEAQTGRVGRFEGFCPTASGTPKWWDVSIAPLYGESAAGNASRFLVVSRDDTARKLAADALRIERERLAAIIDTSQDLMFLKDPELRYLAANKAHETVLGLAPRDMIGKTDFDLLPKDMAASCRATDLAALREGSVLLDEKVGETWYRVSKRRVENDWGLVLGVAALITDVTVSRNAYDALRESEELFRNLVESAPEAIFVQTKGRFAYVNSASLKLYGATGPEDLLDSFLLSRIHPDFHAQASERVRRVNVERLPNPPMEQRHLRLDGRFVDVEISAVPLLYGGENGSLVFVHDITERKREEALRSDMERIVKHDLKGPLNAVINLPLLYQDDPNLSRDQVEALRLIHRAGLSMLEQIDQSLTLYRIETGSFKLSPLAVELQVTAEAGLAPISGDGLLCRTMFSNLLKNAVEASHRGGVVQVRLCAAGDWAEWSAHNAGTVPEALRKSFFDKYSTHGKRQGAGLGTYSARLSAEAQGGSIAMHSSEALGTTITVRLPLWRAGA
ncbi:MAG: hypothetical protein A2051_02610 [Desulfovibrionales bacterium GWA2_65_9]|nr:MAG: hypothetical protein A2051_02610 [Desulfovibrionales bacterium GWA2_65_9]